MTVERAVFQFHISNSSRHAIAFPRRIAPELCEAAALRKESRGRRECRVKASPMARLQQRKQAAVTTGSARSSGIPCAMVLTLIRALPGDRLDCPRLRQRAKARCAGRQHRGARTTRLHVRVEVVRRHDLRSRCNPIRPSHPASRVVTIARNAPLGEAGWEHDP